ncbi:MAG: glycosyltransferase family 4 protein [Gammaproteobacteria bacterium]|nr:glycosyltransferase family 4 protein [Gammaproteobacteria bacterium]
MSTKTERFWLLLDSSKPGGIESHVLQLADGLTHHGREVQVVFLTHYGNHPLRNELHRRDIPTISLNGRLRALWQAIRKSRPSILHTHGYKAGLYGRLAARLCRIPVVSTYHAGEAPSGKLALYDWLDRKSAGLAAKVFAVSPQIARRLPVSAELADNFINTTGLKSSNGSQIAFVGRLSWEKGPDRFLQLAEQYSQQQFHLYGHGPMSSELERTAPANVQFHGLQSDMSRIWPRIGLLVMPSRHEGLPMAALEAMARGIPVLASRVGALDQLIESGTNGWLVTPGDALELADRLHQWLELSKQDKRNLQHNARLKVEQRFSAAVAIPRLVNRYCRTAGCCKT